MTTRRTTSKETIATQAMSQIAKFRIGCGRASAFLLLFHDNPANRTYVISTMNTVFFPNTTSCAKILAKHASRVTVKSRIPSRIFLVFPNPALYFGQIPDPEDTLQDTVSDSLLASVSGGGLSKYNTIIKILVTKQRFLATSNFTTPEEEQIPT